MAYATIVSPGRYAGPDYGRRSKAENSFDVGRIAA